MISHESIVGTLSQMFETTDVCYNEMSHKTFGEVYKVGPYNCYQWIYDGPYNWPKINGFAWGYFHPEIGGVIWAATTPSKSRWHSYHVLIYISLILTYLLGTVPWAQKLHPRGSLSHIGSSRGLKGRVLEWTNQSVSSTFDLS